MPFPSGRCHGSACLGRPAVDLYSQRFGARLEDALRLVTCLDGSQANLAFGVASLGCKSAMISRVSDDQMGCFLLESPRRLWAVAPARCRGTRSASQPWCSGPETP